jgi:hypothetical protein
MSLTDKEINARIVKTTYGSPKIIFAGTLAKVLAECSNRYYYQDPNAKDGW